MRLNQIERRFLVVVDDGFVFALEAGTTRIGCERNAATIGKKLLPTN